MEMLTRRMRLWATLLLCALILTGCQGAKKAEDEAEAIVVGFSQLGSESGWRIGNTASMEAAAKAHGCGLMMDNANQKQEKQISAIRSFIAYQVDVIVFSPIVETGWVNVLTEAKNAGIPVIIMDRMVDVKDDSLYAAFIGADFVAEGRRAGEYLLKKADAMGAKRLNIVEITGTENSTPMRGRQKGFQDALGDDPRFAILESISGDFLRSKGEECMRKLLHEHGTEGIDVVFSHNDEMTLGALDVLEAAGLKPGQDILLISVDGQQSAIDELKAGRINCIAECTPDLGETVMGMVEALIQGRDLPKAMHPEETVFTDFDDLSDLPPRGY